MTRSGAETEILAAIDPERTARLVAFGGASFEIPVIIPGSIPANTIGKRAAQDPVIAIGPGRIDLPLAREAHIRTVAA